jgi:glycosyltransferase involved in cell wall biosynthesis
MRLLLAAHHRYPADGSSGSGLEPKAFPSGSGAHIHDTLARGLAELGHEVFYHLPNGFSERLPPRVVPVSQPVAPVDVYHSLLYAQSEENPVGQSMRAQGIPWLISCHMDRRSRGLEPIALPPYTVYVSPSLARSHGSDRFVWNGLDPDRYIFSETKGNYLLFVSALDWAYDKGLDMAFQVARRVGLKLVVAGTARNVKIIEDVRAACLAAGAECVGDVRGRAKAELYAGARALLLPTRLNEGCPLVIIEALMSGTPVIASGRGGCADMVTPGVGFICETEDDYAGAVAQTGDLAPTACRRHALERYHYLRMAEDYVREYRCEMETMGS